MSITYNKNLNPLLNLLINCISARSVPQILSIKGACVFLFLNVLIIGLCHSSASSSSDIISFFTAPLEVFFCEKSYKPLKQVHVDIHHISNF